MFYRGAAPPSEVWPEIAGVVAVPDGAGKLVRLLGVRGQDEPAEAVWFDEVRVYRLR